MLKSKIFRFSLTHSLTHPLTHSLTHGKRISKFTFAAAEFNNQKALNDTL